MDIQVKAWTVDEILQCAVTPAYQLVAFASPGRRAQARGLNRRLQIPGDANHLRAASSTRANFL